MQSISTKGQPNLFILEAKQDEKHALLLPIGNKGFISVYTLNCLSESCLWQFPYFPLRITTLQNAAMADSPIDLYTCRSIKSQLAKQETDENIVEREELTEEEDTTHWQEVYHRKTIIISRSENEIKIRYQHHTIVCMLNDADEIMSYEYI